MQAIKRTIIVTEFTKIYERLDIADLIDRGESFYQNLMGDVVKIMEEKGTIVVSGSICYWLPEVVQTFHSFA